MNNSKQELIETINNNLLSFKLENDNPISEYEGFDSKLMYLKDIHNYDLLSLEEEIFCTNNLQHPENKKLLIINYVDGYIKPTLNISLLFSSLENCSSYMFIIDSLISFYNKMNNNADSIDSLIKYKKIAQELNRQLNSEEIVSNFDVKLGTESLEESRLLHEVNEFIKYKYSFNKLYVSNLRLVLSIACAYRNKCQIDLIDLIAEGNFGLIKAIEKFDVSLGCRFSTYATYWIRQSISRYIASYNSSVRLPENIYRELARFIKKVNKLELQFGKNLSHEEISSKLGIPIEKVEEYYKNMDRPVYLDNTIKENEDSTIGDFIASDDDIEDEVFRNTLNSDIRELFIPLNEKEIQVIKMRFGFDEYMGKELSLVSIANKIGMSPEGVRRIQYRALLKIRRYLRTNKLSRELEHYL